jgi:3-isopropylmalate/(R)-2-methylmalate dehydratase small subunit
VLPIKLSEEQVEDLFQRASKPGYKLTIDLNTCRITDAQGLSLSFTVDESRRHCLLNGLDDIALTLKNEDKIAAYERSRGMAM